MGEVMTEQRRVDALRCIETQLDDGYIDLGLNDQDELEVVKEAIRLLKAVDQLNSLGCTSFVFTEEDAKKLKQNGNIRVYDHIWDVYLDEFEDEEA